MDFKKRLLVAFCIITIIPVFLLVTTVKVIVTTQLDPIYESYDAESDTLQFLSNPMSIFSGATADTYEKMQKCAMETPEKFENALYLAGLNNQLAKSYSFLVVRKQDEIVFSGNEQLNQRIIEYLPHFSSRQIGQEDGVYVGGENSVLLKQQDFYFTDGAEGSAFIITDLSTVLPQVKNSILQTILSLVVIILFTAIVLVVWLYRSFVRPLTVLKEATQKMKHGNLDFTIEGDPEDELGRLCEDFEEMRIHLKELIEVRMQYENDTKELISNISHDLKTPLTAIKGYAEGIMDGVADTKEKKDKYIRTIYTKASDMSVLVDELAFYSKIDSNTVPYNFTVLDVDRYFTDCIEELSLDLEVKNVLLQYINLAGTGQRILADAEQLKRVINNIIGNSVKYLDKPDGIIRMKICELGSHIQISIEDNGCGISKEDLPNIFDRFFRADASRNSKKGGTGLGLAIAKKIIEEHMGQIWATSEAGTGTTVLFTLPKWYPSQAHEQRPLAIPKKGVKRR